MAGAGGEEQVIPAHRELIAEGVQPDRGQRPWRQQFHPGGRVGEPLRHLADRIGTGLRCPRKTLDRHGERGLQACQREATHAVDGAPELVLDMLRRRTRWVHERQA